MLQLASRLNLKYPRKFIFLLFLPHFCFPLGHPWGNHAKGCMDGKIIRCLRNCLAACTHLSSTVSQLFEPQVPKNPRFHVPQPTFLFPLETPLRLSRNMLYEWKDNSSLQTPRSTYLSIFNSFRVIRCLNQCVSPKIAIFITFLFPLGTLLGQSR